MSGQDLSVRKNVEGEKDEEQKKADGSKNKKWTCSSCWVPNEEDAVKCICCGALHLKPSSGTTEAKNEKSGLKPWSCPDCFVPNQDNVAKCVCCGHERKVYIFF